MITVPHTAPAQGVSIVVTRSSVSIANAPAWLCAAGLSAMILFAYWHYQRRIA